MKYFGQPGMSVIDYENLKTVFVFDENGEFETNDQFLISWMKKNKYFIPCEESVPVPTVEQGVPEGKEAVMTVVTAGMPVVPETPEGTMITVVTAADPEPPKEPEPAAKVFKCKKCDFTTDSARKLSAHTRKEHPKEDAAG